MSTGQGFPLTFPTPFCNRTSSKGNHQSINLYISRYITEYSGVWLITSCVEEA